ncbi:MAG: hypothetical protein PWP64_1099 [Candidatus Cloacimonadota bacterium]|nr:hypothetical protein [Candidatus Cloacimonadota bacterium]
MPSNNQRNNELEFTPTFETQQLLTDQHCCYKVDKNLYNIITDSKNTPGIFIWAQL